MGVKKNRINFISTTLGLLDFPEYYEDLDKYILYLQKWLNNLTPEEQINMFGLRVFKFPEDRKVLYYIFDEKDQKFKFQIPLYVKDTYETVNDQPFNIYVLSNNFFIETVEPKYYNMLSTKNGLKYRIQPLKDSVFYEGPEDNYENSKEIIQDVLNNITEEDFNSKQEYVIHNFIKEENKHYSYVNVYEPYIKTNLDNIYNSTYTKKEFKKSYLSLVRDIYYIFKDKKSIFTASLIEDELLKIKERDIINQIDFNKIDNLIKEVSERLFLDENLKIFHYIKSIQNTTKPIENIDKIIQVLNQKVLLDLNEPLILYLKEIKEIKPNQYLIDILDLKFN